MTNGCSLSAITPGLLNDTLNLIQLARETARLQGNMAQAERLTPVVDGLANCLRSDLQSDETRSTRLAGKIVPGATQTVPTPATANPASVGGLMGQDDFKTLLAVAQSPHRAASSGAAGRQRPLEQFSIAATLERNGAVAAMNAGGMSDVDIARQMGMTRDEVRMVLALGQK